MRKKIFGLVKETAALFFILSIAISINQSSSLAENWTQNTQGWIEFNSADAPSILIDSTFHRSTSYVYWWPDRNNNNVCLMKDIPVNTSIYISRYLPYEMPDPAENNWLSWDPRGWKIENNSAGIVRAGAGNSGINGDKEEYCKIDTTNSSSPSNVILSQGYVFLDPRNYQISVTAKTTSSGPITLLITKSNDEILFSQEIILGLSDTSGWENYTFKFACNDTYYDAKIKLLLGLGAGPLGGTIKFDEISLVPLNTDIAPLPQEPAGNHGFLRVDENGDYYFADNPDKKIKFFGFSINISHPFPEEPPTHRDSEIIAQRLAAQGCNVVRIQGIETAIFTPYITATQINYDKLDKLDYLIYQLKQRGIYIILETLGNRADRVGDGLAEVSELKHTRCRMQNMFDPTRIDILKSYISELFFEHTNPYTNKTYIEDAVNQWIIIANEFNLPMEWSEQKLNGIKYCVPSLRNKFMPERYSNQLDEMWNNYLLAKYGTRDNLKKAWSETNTAEQPQIGGINLIWDPNFEFSAQQATPQNNGFTHIFYAGSSTTASTGYANDFWAYSEFTNGGGIDTVELTDALGENSPPGIAQAIKIHLTANSAGDINKAKFWPTPAFGAGSYRYDNSPSHDYEKWNSINLEANNEYVLTFWAKADTAQETEPFEKLRVESRGWYETNPEANIYQIRKDFNISPDWRQYTAIFTPRFDSTQASLAFFAGGRGNGYLYITGVNLYKRSNNAVQDFTFESAISDYLWKYSIPPTIALEDAVNFVDEGLGALDNRSLMVTVPAGQDIIVYQNHFDIRADKWYTLAFYAKDETNQANSIAVSLVDESGGQIMGTTIAPLFSIHPGTSGWNYYWIPFKTSVSRLNSTLKFTFHNTSSAQKIYYLDQAKLLGGNQIENGDFYLGSFTGWNLHMPNYTQGQCFVPANEKYCHIKMPGGSLDNIAKKQLLKTKIVNLSAVKLEQSGISLEKNRSYTIRFKAMSANHCLANVGLAEAKDNGQSLGKDSFELTPQWNEFTTTFNAPNRNILNAQLSFYLTGNENDIFLTDIKIEDEGQLIGLGQDEEPSIPQIIRYINFQPNIWNNTVIPDAIGYEIDRGEPYTEDRGFGWVALPQGSQFVSGPGLPDVADITTYPAYAPGKDTTAIVIPNQSEAAAHWRIELPPGKYLVSAACGDPRAGTTQEPLLYQTNNYLRFEDTVIFDGDIAVYSSYSCPKPAIYIGEKEIDAGNDGYLDIYIGEGPGGGNTALRYLTIKQAKNANGNYIVQRPLFMHLPLSTKGRANDIIKFYRDIENSYYKQMSDHLKLLGAGQQIISTQNYWSMTELENQDSYDATTSNAYFNLNGGCTAMIKYENFVRTPICEAGLLNVKGKPFLSTEYNELFPDHFRAEGLTMKSAYNAFQGSDLLIDFVNWSSYYDRLSGIDSNNSPTFYGMLPVISRTITRNDISPSLNEIDLAYTKEEVLESLVKYGSQSSFCVEGGMPAEISLVTGIRRADFETDCRRTIDDYNIDGYIQNNFPHSKGGGNENSEWFISDTGQLKWNPTDGIFTLNTPNTQMIVGYLANAEKVLAASAHLDNLAIDGAVTTTGVTAGNINLGFANISLTSLTDQPINISPKLFLSLVGREANTNQIWVSNWAGTGPFFAPPTQLAKINNVEQIGQPPVMAEPVRARLKIAVDPIVSGNSVKVYKLNPCGQILGQVENVTFDGSKITIDLNQEPEIESIWYVIERCPYAVLE